MISAEFNFVYGPLETLERYALYPDTVDELAVQLSVTECATGWTPVPDRETAAGELVALLVTVTVPGRLPAAAGGESYVQRRNLSWRHNLSCADATRRISSA